MNEYTIEHIYKEGEIMICPLCHAKRVEQWGEWARETLLLDVPHRQVVMTLPKTLRIFFKFRRRLLGDLCRTAARKARLLGVRV
jgi:hypothetical protein